MSSFAYGREEVLPGRAQKVLVADDEYLIRWSLTLTLSREGYEVVSVDDGKKAIEAVRMENFDYIVVDLVMPELDGWEVLKMVQQIQPSSRVIIITAHSKEGTRKVAEERGAWAYVEKPFIIDNIKSLLNGAQREKSNLN